MYPDWWLLCPKQVTMLDILLNLYLVVTWMSRGNTKRIKMDHSRWTGWGYRFDAQEMYLTRKKKKTGGGETGFPQITTPDFTSMLAWLWQRAKQRILWLFYYNSTQISYGIVQNTEYHSQLGKSFVVNRLDQWWQALDGEATSLI